MAHAFGRAPASASRFPGDRQRPRVQLHHRIELAHVVTPDALLRNRPPVPLHSVRPAPSASACRAAWLLASSPSSSGSAICAQSCQCLFKRRKIQRSLVRILWFSQWVLKLCAHTPSHVPFASVSSIAKARPPLPPRFCIVPCCLAATRWLALAERRQVQIFPRRRQAVWAEVADLHLNLVLCGSAHVF